MYFFSICYFKPNLMDFLLTPHNKDRIYRTTKIICYAEACISQKGYNDN